MTNAIPTLHEWLQAAVLSVGQPRRDPGVVRAETRARVRRWEAEFPERVNAKNARRRAQRLRAHAKWSNHFFVDEAYDLARRRTKATGISWHVDHVVPLRSQIVCGLHCEQNLSVITKHENESKNNRSWPHMPRD